MGHDLGLTVNVSTWVTEITEEKGEFDDSFLGAFREGAAQGLSSCFGKAGG